MARRKRPTLKRKVQVYESEKSGPCVCGEDDPNPFCIRCMGYYSE